MSKDSEKLANLQRLVPLVIERTKALPAFNWQDRAPYDKALDAMVERLAREEGASMGAGRLYEARFSLGGVSSSSTGGKASAITNWITAAIKQIVRLEAELS